MDCLHLLLHAPPQHSRLRTTRATRSSSHRSCPVTTLSASSSTAGARQSALDVSADLVYGWSPATIAAHSPLFAINSASASALGYCWLHLRLTWLHVLAQKQPCSTLQQWSAILSFSQLFYLLCPPTACDRPNLSAPGLTSPIDRPPHLYGGSMGNDITEIAENDRNPAGAGVDAEGGGEVLIIIMGGNLATTYLACFRYIFVS